MPGALRRHWPEYLIEAFALGAFMVSACLFGALLWHPHSPLGALLPEGLPRRAVMGSAMGLTAIALIYSPWGQRSGAHMNPAVTLTFVRLGKAKAEDGLYYVAAQGLGGLAGVLISAAVLGTWLSHPAVHYVVTAPHAGTAIAFAAETAIAFLMMTLVLTLSRGAYSRWTGVGAGVLVACFIAFEEPLSGMSLNPARTLASAIPAMDFTGLWIYLLAPPLGMLLAAQAFLAVSGRAKTGCAKLHHTRRYRCLFCQDTGSGNAASLPGDEAGGG
jgi:aquaporin Z